MLTGYGSIATAVEAVRAGAVHYLSKPVDIRSDLGGIRRQEHDDPANRPGRAELGAGRVEHIQRVLSDCDGNISQARAAARPASSLAAA